MKHKIYLASLGLAVLPLAACGGGDNTAKSSAPATVSSSPSSSTTRSSTNSASAPSSSNASPKSSAATVTKTVAPSSTPHPNPPKSAPRNSAAPAAGANSGRTFPAPDATRAEVVKSDPTAGRGGTLQDCSAGGVQINANYKADCTFAQSVARTWAGSHVGSSGTTYVKAPNGDTFGLLCAPATEGASCVTSEDAYVWMSA